MIKNIILSGLMMVWITGCASGLNSVENRRYAAYEAQGALVKEKNPTAGAWFGLLPGGGSFYAREPGWGVVNLLLWPASILWDPFSGYQGSKSINYVYSTAALEQRKRAEIDNLTNQLAADEIDQRQYTIQKNQIESKYTFK